MIDDIKWIAILEDCVEPMNVIHDTISIIVNPIAWISSFRSIGPHIGYQFLMAVTDA